ncbi:MAG: hypothetical protein ACT4PU_08175 [Planctomycetota bacterium]
MILGTGCLGERSLDGPAIQKAMEASGLERSLLVMGVATSGRARSVGLGSVRAAAVRTSWEAFERAVVVAGTTRCRRIVLELPRLLGVERACRELHALVRAHAGLELALLTPEGGPLAEPAALALVLADLKAQHLSYWHRPARVRVLGQTDAAWLDQLSGALVGLSLDDVVDGEAGLPPGLGVLDFAALAELTTPSTEVALDVGPLTDIALLRFTVHSLRTAGFS